MGVPEVVHDLLRSLRIVRIDPRERLASHPVVEFVVDDEYHLGRVLLGDGLVVGADRKRSVLTMSMFMPLLTRHLTPGGTSASILSELALVIWPPGTTWADDSGHGPKDDETRDPKQGPKAENHSGRHTAILAALPRGRQRRKGSQRTRRRRPAGSRNAKPAGSCKARDRPVRLLDRAQARLQCRTSQTSVCRRKRVLSILRAGRAPRLARDLSGRRRKRGQGFG